MLNGPISRAGGFDSDTRYEGWPRARTGQDGKARHLDLASFNQAGLRTVNPHGEGSNPSARAMGP